MDFLIMAKAQEIDIGKTRPRIKFGRFALILILLIAILALSPGLSKSQLSPGELSKPHAYLEGVKNCYRCHDFEKKVSADKCLSCHVPLADRIQAKEGLHSRPEFKNCPDCHVEHQGIDYQLVYWKDGQAQFDHSKTGYSLAGKHLGLDCRKCHRNNNIQIKDPLLAKNVDLDRTFLGLVTECRSCHIDEHRGQFSQACDKCHTPSGWNPATGFNHAETDFPLKGQHVQAKCEKCHQAIVDHLSKADTAYIKFTGIPHQQCTECHTDIHAGKFGPACETCHTVAGWRNVASAQFDHAKTAYPLLGKHARVLCEKCHSPGKSLKIAQFSQCSDCHADYHQGQFSQATNGSVCEKCHTTDGYEFSTCGIESHSKTNYPLLGSHLAVPCTDCHTKFVVAGKEAIVKFKFDSTRCMGCHQDPHKGQVDKYIQANGCEFCHKVDSWANVDFDHSKTKFVLEGKHKQIECSACHKSNSQLRSDYQIIGLNSACQNCHTDIHQGQFIDSSNDLDIDKKTDCGRCHSPNSWKAEKFDHNRDSSFKLDGAHAKLTCGDCHKESITDNARYITYKSLDKSCSSCHGGKGMKGSGS